MSLPLTVSGTHPHADTPADLISAFSSTVRWDRCDADHGQFYVQDLEPYDAWMAEHAMDPDLPPAGWTEEAVHVHRIGVEPHSISVGTARDDRVESVITVHVSAPTIEPTAEHVVEVDLDAPTGQIAVSSPGVDPENGPASPSLPDCSERGSPESLSRLIQRVL